MWKSENGEVPHYICVMIKTLSTHIYNYDIIGLEHSIPHVYLTLFISFSYLLILLNTRRGHACLHTRIHGFLPTSMRLTPHG